VRLLLDTHALLWWFAGDPRFRAGLRPIIADAGNLVFVSAATAWEIATKHRLGRLPSVALIVQDIEGYARGAGFQPLPVTVRHAQLAGALPGPHRDPFDRMLIAQALEEGCTLVSNETLFDRYGVLRTW
jgi:PIN domain nuclease of toxin-antitoxin system